MLRRPPKGEVVVDQEGRIAVKRSGGRPDGPSLASSVVLIAKPIGGQYEFPEMVSDNEYFRRIRHESLDRCRTFD